MIAIIIILSMFLLIFLLLQSPVRVHIFADNNSALVTIHYLFFKKKVYPISPEKEKKSKKIKKTKPKKAEQEKPEEKKNDLSKNIGMAKAGLEILKQSKRALRRLLRGIVVYKVKLELAVAKEDAFQTAMAYGKTSSAIAVAIALFGEIITLKPCKINATPDFTKQSSVYTFSMRVRLRPATILASGIDILVQLLKIKLKSKPDTKKQKQKQKGGLSHEPTSN